MQHPCGVCGTDDPHAAGARWCTEEQRHDQVTAGRHLLVGHALSYMLGGRTHAVRLQVVLLKLHSFIKLNRM